MISNLFLLVALDIQQCVYSEYNEYEIIITLTSSHLKPKL